MGVRKVTLVSLLVLILVLVSLPKIKEATAQDPTISITSDGNVEGTNSINRIGDLYIFTENITNRKILVEKDNIVIDGESYTLTGAEGRGIVLQERNNITIRNLNLEMDGGYGIYLVDTSNCLISDNTVAGDAYNIYLWRSFNNTIEGNTIKNAFRGILIYDSDSNFITGNIVTDGVVGIELHDCANNVFKNNQMNNNRANFEVRSYPTYRVANDIDTSNTINGAPIYYWVNEKDRSVPPNSGCVILINCTRITAKNLNLAQNGQGILLFFTTNSTLTQNTILGAGGRGIELVHSSNIKIIENTVQNFSSGIQLAESSFNTIMKNIVVYNDRGIVTESNSKENMILENEINSNEYGISEAGGSNIISDNKIEKNGFGISVRSSNNIVSENVISTNSEMGIILDASSNNLSGNNITNNSNYGLYISGGNTLRNNRMSNNRINFDVRGTSFENYVDTSNLVDGKPIIYWVNQQDKSVPHDAGYVALVKCENITVQNVYIANNGDGIFLAFTNNSKIIGNNITNNNNGITFWGSSNNRIIGNNIRTNGDGIFFSGATFLDVFHYPSRNNTIYNNNFLENENNVADVAGSWWIAESTPAVNIWDNGTYGNYWSNYNGTDNNGDGIGDTPYIINDKNQDNYPLMEPIDIVTIPEFPPWTILILFLVATFSVIVIKKGINDFKNCK